MTNSNFLLCFITKEWYFWGNITIFHLFCFNMIASFWTWQMTILGCFWLFGLASPLKQLRRSYNSDIPAGGFQQTTGLSKMLIQKIFLNVHNVLTQRINDIRLYFFTLAHLKQNLTAIIFIVDIIMYLN